MDTNGLGRRIAALRKSKGLNQTQLAKRIGVKQSSLSDIESGKTKDPAVTTVFAIANLFQTSVRYLLTGRGEAKGDGVEDPDESDMLMLFRALDSVGRAGLLASAHAQVGEKAKLSPQDQRIARAAQPAAAAVGIDSADSKVVVTSPGRAHHEGQATARRTAAAKSGGAKKRGR